MDRFLLVSGSDKGREYLYDIVSSCESAHIDTVKTAGAARRSLVNLEYDIIIINAPMQDENGIELAIDISTKWNTSVILVVKSEYFEQVQDCVESAGVYVLSKPVSRQGFYHALQFVLVASRKMLMLLQKQKTLKKQLEDIKIIDRAKCCLIEYLKMSENEAHRHIEKQAMDLRRTKRMIAEDILKTYEM